MAYILKARAFTLIELLVVVTIIVVLLALLVPAMDRALAHASSVVCMTNLRTWSIAMRQYSLEHKGAKVLVTTEISKYWWAPLSSYVGEPGFSTRPLGDLVLKAGLCPDAPMSPGQGMEVPSGVSAEAGGTGYSTGSKWGSASKAWQWGASTIQGGPPLAHTAYASYGTNNWTTNCDQNSLYDAANYYGRYATIRGEVPWMGDCNWVAAWPDDEDLPTADTENGNAGGDWTMGGQMGRFVLNRHNVGRMAVNLSFVDGSARNVRLGELWNLPWHRNLMRDNSYDTEGTYP